MWLGGLFDEVNHGLWFVSVLKVQQSVQVLFIPPVWLLYWPSLSKVEVSSIRECPLPDTPSHIWTVDEEHSHSISLTYKIVSLGTRVLLHFERFRAEIHHANPAPRSALRFSTTANTPVFALTASLTLGLSGNHTLQPTALVNEAYLRLGSCFDSTWQDGARVLGKAANVMRHILVDYARAHNAGKRGEGQLQVTLVEDAVAGTTTSTVDILAVDEALRASQSLIQGRHKFEEIARNLYVDTYCKMRPDNGPGLAASEAIVLNPI
jgi:hypothetical protein